MTLHPQHKQAARGTRFCIGAARCSPKDRKIEKAAELVRALKALELETCATLGMLEDGHTQNQDNSPDFLWQQTADDWHSRHPGR